MSSVLDGTHTPNADHLDDTVVRGGLADHLNRAIVGGVGGQVNERLEVAYARAVLAETY